MDKSEFYRAYHGHKLSNLKSRTPLGFAVASDRPG
jgi:hypothetical protein